MAVLIPSRRLTVLVGADNQDWSACAGPFVVGRDSLGENGLIATTATLTLQRNLSAPASLDPENNPTRWRPGQRVRVRTQNGAGAVVDHPQGWLYLLSEPIYDEAAGLLPLTLGCWLAWADSQEPADDASAVVLGTAEDTSVICQRYLEAAGIPGASIALGGPWGYSVALPQTKPEGSYVSKAGELAYASGYRVLYQDSAGIVRSMAVSTTAGTPDLLLDLNTDNLRFERLADPQEPFEVIRVAGVGATVAAVLTPIEDTQGDASTETFTRQAYDLAVSVIVGPNASITPVTPGTYASRTTRLRFRQSKDQVIEGITGDSAFIVVDDTTEIRYYEKIRDDLYRLYQIFRFTEKARSVFDSSSPNADSTRRTQEIGVTYTYDSDGRLSQVEEDVWEVELLYQPGGSDAARRLVRRKVQQWTPKGTDLYEYLGTEKAARIAISQNAGTALSNPWQLVQFRPADLKPASAKGENTPPATEEWEGPYAVAETPYEGQVTWTHRGGATGRTRTRTFQLPAGLAFSDGLCAAIAAIHRDLLDGRKRGRLVQLAITDALLAYDAPLPQLEVLCLDGFTRTYLLDSLSWEHQGDRAFCEGLGILIAEVAP